MLIELKVDFGQKRKMIDTEKIASVSGIEERWIGDTSNRRYGWNYYTIQLLDNSEIEVKGLVDELRFDREILLDYWNMDKKQIVRI